MQTDALATIPVKDWIEILVEDLTKKHADASGGGHYRQTWGTKRSWCCDRCRTINAALKDLAQQMKGRL